MDDLVDGIYRLLLSDEHLPVNIGNPTETSILEFAKIINRLAGNTAGLDYQPDKRFGNDPQRRCPDISRARSLLGWEPKVDLVEGLTRTMAYFKEKMSMSMTNIITNPQERTRFLKFMAVGVIGAVVDFGIMNLFSKLFGMALVWAGTISFICAIISNFIWNRYWTYPDSRSRPISGQLVMFFIVNVAGLAIRLPILHFLEPPMRSLFARLSLNIFTPEFLGKNFTLAVAVGVVMLWNFFVNRYWTYNDVDKVKS